MAAGLLAEHTSATGSRKAPHLHLFNFKKLLKSSSPRPFILVMSNAAHLSMEVDRYSPRFEATAKQTRYATFLAGKAGTTVLAVAEQLWGMSSVCAFSDRPWGRLTRRECSKVIDALRAQVG